VRQRDAIRLNPDFNPARFGFDLTRGGSPFMYGQAASQESVLNFLEIRIVEVGQTEVERLSIVAVK